MTKLCTILWVEKSFFKLYYLLSSVCLAASVPAAIKCETIRHIRIHNGGERGNHRTLWLIAEREPFGTLQLEFTSDSHLLIFGLFSAHTHPVCVIHD